MSFIDEMRGLREDIESGKKIRRQRVQEIKKEVKTFQKETQAKQQEFRKTLAEARAAFWGKKKPT